MRMLNEKEKQALRARFAERNENHRPNKLTNNDRSALIRAYINGAKLADLARKYGIAPQTARYHVLKAAQ